MTECNEDESEEKNTGCGVDKDDLVLRECVHERVYVVFHLCGEREDTRGPEPGAELEEPPENEHAGRSIDGSVHDVVQQAERPLRKEALEEKIHGKEEKVHERCRLHDPRNPPKKGDKPTYRVCSSVWAVHWRASSSV